MTCFHASRSPAAPLALMLVLSACGETSSGDSTSATSSGSATSTDGSSGSTSAGTASGGTSTASGTSGGTTATSGSSGASGGSGNFLNDPDGGTNECDVWAQDCPDGQKCMPWASDGGNSWNATKCSPVDPNGGSVGDPCTPTGNAVSGEDDCGPGLMCYLVQVSDGMGVCHELCGGTPADPMCETADTTCAVYNDGVLPLCLFNCDPLLADCGTGQLCLSSPDGGSFVCIIDALPNDDGSYGTPCQYINNCDPGLFCATPANVPNCTDSGCCSEFCDLMDPSGDAQCTGQPDGQICLPWWGMEPAPPGYESVGFCGIP
jgi:hypothetical protein